MSRQRLGTKAEMINEIIDEVKHTAVHHPEKLNGAMNIIRVAMMMSVKAAGLRDFMKNEFPFMIDECEHTHYDDDDHHHDDDDGHVHGPHCNH